MDVVGFAAACSVIDSTRPAGSAYHAGESARDQRSREDAAIRGDACFERNLTMVQRRLRALPALLLAGAAVIAFAACGGGDGEETPSPTATAIDAFLREDAPD